MTIFLPRSKVSDTVLKKLPTFIFLLLFFHPLVAAAQVLDLPKPSRPSHFIQSLIPQTQPLSSALPDMEEEAVRAASAALFSSLFPANAFSLTANAFSLTMNPPSSSAVSAPLSTEILPYPNALSTAPGSSAGATTVPSIIPTASSAGLIPQALPPYPPVNTAVTATDTASRQAARYQQGYAPGSQQQAAPVMMAAPFAPSAGPQPAFQSLPPVGPVQAPVPAPYVALPQPVPFQPVPLPGIYQQYLPQPLYAQASRSQQALAQPSYPSYIQPSWAVNASPISSPWGFVSVPSFGPGPFAYLPSTPYLPSPPYFPPTAYGNNYAGSYGNAAGNPFPASPPYLLLSSLPSSPQSYPFSLAFWPII